MIPAIVTQSVGFVLLVLALIMALRGAGKQLKGVLVGALVCMGASTALMYALLVQEKTGTNLGVPGGIASDARTWMHQHSQPPTKSDVGTNIKILSDSVSFLKSHQSQLRPAAKAKFDELLRVPDKPKRLLTVSEEAQYFEAAKNGYAVIGELAGEAATP